MPLTFTTYEKVQALPSLPLWPGYWPRGEVVGLYGHGGVGKGRALIDLAARITRGDPMPFCDEQTEPGSVMLILPEDHPQEQVRPRLDAAKADVSLVVDMTRGAGGERFKLSALKKQPGDIGKLREAIEVLKISCRYCRDESGNPLLWENGRCPQCHGTDTMNPRLIIIDPLMAVLGWGSINTVTGARVVIEPLQDLAMSTGVTIVLVMHSTKAGTIQGSAGVVQTLRLLYKIEFDTNPLVRVIRAEKSNNQADTPAVKYTLEGDQDGGVRVVWLSREEQDKRNQSWRDVPARPVQQVTGESLPPEQDGRQFAQSAGKTGQELRPGDEYGAAVRIGRVLIPLGRHADFDSAYRACVEHSAYREGSGWEKAEGGWSATVRDGKTITALFLIANLKD